MGLVSEESSSSYADESGLELGLSLGGGGRTKLGFSSKMLTGSPSSLSSSSSSSAPNHVSPPANTLPSNQVVGWPPIRAYRMNSMVNHVKYPCNDEFQSTVEKCKNKNVVIDMNDVEVNKNYLVNEEGPKTKSNFVKVHMDGNGIGRKVEMSAHSCYETLAQTMEAMFFGAPTAKRSKLMDGSSEFVLTYEDKDGDWMLVGDVPWRMFINSVKRLRIMRTSEANGLGSKFQVRNVRQSMPI